MGARSSRIAGELERHQRERECGGVVLSVLGGPAVQAVDFVRWANARGAIVVVAEVDSFEGACQAVVARLPIVRLQRAARRAVAAASNCDVEDIEAGLMARSSVERGTWLAELAAGRPSLHAAGWVLASLAERPALEISSSRVRTDRLIAGLAAFMDPLAILVVPAPAATGDSLGRATAIAARLSELLAPHAVALGADRGGLDELFATAADRAELSLARQGLIELALPDHQELATGGRSDAERTLHAALDRDLRTRGRFALSHRLQILFNGHRAEIDLYDAELALAVEIDGWHHFRSPDGYRRDREKDALLQRAGVLVLRVLEQDVWNRLDYLVEWIAHAVADRHRARISSCSQHTR